MTAEESKGVIGVNGTTGAAVTILAGLDVSILLKTVGTAAGFTY